MNVASAATSSRQHFAPVVVVDAAWQVIVVLVCAVTVTSNTLRPPDVTLLHLKMSHRSW